MNGKALPAFPPMNYPESVHGMRLRVIEREHVSHSLPDQHIRLTDIRLPEKANSWSMSYIRDEVVGGG